MGLSNAIVNRAEDNSEKNSVFETNTSRRLKSAVALRVHSRKIDQARS